MSRVFLSDSVCSLLARDQLVSNPRPLQADLVARCLGPRLRSARLQRCRGEIGKNFKLNFLPDRYLACRTEVLDGGQDHYIHHYVTLAL